MADVRVRMQCSEYGLTDAVIAVGWDTILNYKPDEDFANYRFSVKGEMQITCNPLPKFTWDVDVEGDPWASFVIMDNGCYIFQVSVDVFCGGIWLQDILVGEYLKKGRPVYVEGRLKTRKWQDKDGVDKYTTEIVCDHMQMLGARDDAPSGRSGWVSVGAQGGRGACSSAPIPRDWTTRAG